MTIQEKRELKLLLIKLNDELADADNEANYYIYRVLEYIY